MKKSSCRICSLIFSYKYFSRISRYWNLFTIYTSSIVYNYTLLIKLHLTTGVNRNAVHIDVKALTGFINKMLVNIYKNPLKHAHIWMNGEVLFDSVFVIINGPQRKIIHKKYIFSQLIILLIQLVLQSK